MNLNIYRIAGLATALVLVATCLAQHESPTAIVITGHPYSARRTITTTRRLPDGTSGKTVVELLLWRDDKGRTRQEQIQRSPEGSEIHIINVSDPIARRHLAWTVGPRIEKKIMVTPISTPLEMAEHGPGSDLTPAQRAQAIAQRRNPKLTGESLGTAVINGVKATGLRTVAVIAEGQKLVHEQWRSTESEDIIVRSITDDPRRGTTDSELTEINFSNPATSLFEPPPGYRVQIVTPSSK